MDNLGQNQGPSPRKSPHPSLMFGYEFPGDDPPPPPPAGPALLDDSELHTFDEFLDVVGSSQLDLPSNFLFEGGNSDSSYAFTFDLPPVFEGSTTSLSQPRGALSQPQTISQALPTLSFNTRIDRFPNVDQPVSNTASAEVMAAANTLMQNGQIQHLNGTTEGSVFPSHVVADTFRDPFSNSRTPSEARPFNVYSSLRNGSVSAGPSNLSHSSMYPAIHTIAQHEPLFQPLTQPNASGQSLRKNAEVRFGSDSAFDRGYSHLRVTEDLTNRMMRQMDCLDPRDSVSNTANNTASNTAPGSPNTVKRQVDIHEPQVAGAFPQEGNDSKKDDENYEKYALEEPKPKRRRKSTMKEEISSDVGLALSSMKKSRQSSKSRRKSSTKTDSSILESSKSGSPRLKLTRENLTDEQKRSNHILSEQKRRNLIKKGFEELCELVPGLNDGGFSKSAMLSQAADWLEDLLRGNAELNERLLSLKQIQGT